MLEELTKFFIRIVTLLCVLSIHFGTLVHSLCLLFLLDLFSLNICLVLAVKLACVFNSAHFVQLPIISRAYEDDWWERRYQWRRYNTRHSQWKWRANLRTTKPTSGGDATRTHSTKLVSRQGKLVEGIFVSGGCGVFCTGCLSMGSWYLFLPCVFLPSLKYVFEDL